MRFTIFAAVRRSFLRIGHLGRDKLNDKYQLAGWTDDAHLWLNHQQIYPSAVTGNDFVCAVLAHGDVDRVPLDRFPFDCGAFGLRRDSSGRPATYSWRNVLAIRRLRPRRSLSVGAIDHRAGSSHVNLKFAA